MKDVSIIVQNTEIKKKRKKSTRDGGIVVDVVGDGDGRYCGNAGDGEGQRRRRQRPDGRDASDPCGAGPRRYYGRVAGGPYGQDATVTGMGGSLSLTL